MKQVLDPCCGGRMFWFDKNDQRCLFGDIRSADLEFPGNRVVHINPDIRMDFRELPFPDDSFYLVSFDPPHLVHAGDKSWLALKYGRLGQDWKEDIKKGFSECFRVLKPNGTLIFKWNETQIKVKEILELTDQKPLFGHRSGKKSNTHWITFMKGDL